MGSRSAEKEGVLPHLPAEVLTKWQGIVDLMAQTIGVPAGLIMRADPPEIMGIFPALPSAASARERTFSRAFLPVSSNTLSNL